MVQKHLLNLYPARTAWMLSGARRVAAVLLMMLLTMTAQTAWAQEPKVLPVKDGNGDVTITESGTYNATGTFNNIIIADGVGLQGPVILNVGNLTINGNIQGQPIIWNVSDGSSLTFTGDGPIQVDELNMTGGQVHVNNMQIMSECTISGGTINGTGDMRAQSLTINLGTISGGSFNTTEFTVSNVTISGGTINTTTFRVDGEVTIDAANSSLSITANFFQFYEGVGSITITSGSLTDGTNEYKETITEISTSGVTTLTPVTKVTVTLDAQGGSGGTTSVEATPNIAMPSITPPSWTGYIFGGYFTQTNGGGEKYYNDDGSSAKDCDLTTATTLYAQWIASTTCTVTLDHQNGTAATSVTATNGVSMPSVTPPIKTGYTFGGYFTQTNGGGEKYYNANGTSAKDCDFTQATTLYAQWTANTYYINFNGNGSTSGGMVSQYFTYDAEPQALSANQYVRAFTVTYNYNGATGGNSDASTTATATFNGWAKSADGEKVYDDGQSVSNLTSGYSIALYAKWTDASITLPTPTKTGYAFGGWYSNEGCTTLVGDAGSSYTPGSDVTLYAKWRKLLTNDDIAIADIPSQTYNGTALTPVITVTDGTGDNAKSLVKGTDYTVSPETATDAGTYTMTLTGIGNYGGTATKTFTINQAKPTANSSPTAQAITYGQTLSDSYVNGTATGVDGSSLTGTWSWVSPSTAPKVSDSGTTGYGVTFTPSNTNYESYSTTTTLTVNKKNLTVTANNHTISYGDAPANNGVTYDGFVEGESQDTEGIFGTTTLSYNYKTAADGTGEDYTASSPAGTYYIIPGGLTATNYDITFVSGTLTVEPVPVKFSVVDIANGEELADATVQVLDGEGNVVEEWVSATGLHEIDVLRTGEEYTVHETVAPEGYIIPADFTFTIGTGGSITSTGSTTTDDDGLVLLVENSKTKVKISVVDIADGEELEGAHVQVLDKDGKVVEEWTSTKVSHVIEGLKTGEEYTLKETVAPEGYALSTETTFTIDEEGKITYTGTKTEVLLVENIKIGDLTVSCVVISDLAADADAEFTFTVTLDDTSISGTYGDMMFENGVATVTLKGGENATATSLPMPTTLTYTVTEADAEGFQLTGKTNDTGTIEATGTTATFTNTRETGDLQLSNRVYADNNDDEFTFTVTLGDTSINGTYSDMTFENGVATVTLNGGEGATATGLPTTLTYTVSQTDKEGYMLDEKTGDTGTISTTTSEATFTNVQLVNATVQIVWNDNNNQDGKRPGSFTVTLSNGTEVTLNEENSWTATVEHLPKYANGVEIEYTWSLDEEGLPEGYELTDTSVDGIVTKLTISYMPEETEATVLIVWDDSHDQDGKRPGSFTVTLSNGTEVTLNEENSWTATVEHLPKYANGEEIVYTWTEDEEGLPEGYELTDTSVNGTVTTLTNSHTPEETEATVELHWNDNNNQDGKRPGSFTVTLSNGTEVTLNEENSWTATVEHLPKYANGVEIEYTWSLDEEGLPEGYELTGSSVSGTVTTLTNTYEPVTSGYCGTTGNEESVTWNYDSSTKTLSISGTGYMMYYNSVQNVDNSYSNGAPWKAFANEIESVTIGNGITYVGSNTFAHCPSISSVTLPTSGIYQIGDGAFGDCTSLESIDIPMSINTIGNQAFAGCSNLATVSIGYGDPGTFNLGSEVFPVTTTILVPESAYENYIKEKAVKESVEIDNPFYGYKDKIVPATRTFFANGTNTWMTWCDVNAWTLPEGCTAYTVSSVSGTTVTLSNALTTIPAYTPVLIQRGENVTAPVTATFSAVGTVPDSGYDSATGIASTTDTEGCTFYGTTTDLATIPEANYSAGLTYVLYGDKFLKSDNNSGIAANRCWLKLEAGGGTSGARLLSIVIDDNPTAIDNVQWSMVNGQSDSWYTIDGRKLSGKPTKKGLYIYNGKKTVVK